MAKLHSRPRFSPGLVWAVLITALVTFGWVTGVLKDVLELHRGPPTHAAKSANPAYSDKAWDGLQTNSAARPGETTVFDLGTLVIPVEGVRRNQLFDTFNQSRAEGARRHDAIDIPAPLGTAVVAAAPGTVERLLISTGGGNTIYVRSLDRLTIYYYAHLDGYDPMLSEGQKVRAGQLLGWVGFSGNANPIAPHLHFAILRTTAEAKWHAAATPINPYPLLIQH